MKKKIPGQHIFLNPSNILALFLKFSVHFNTKGLPSQDSTNEKIVYFHVCFSVMLIYMLAIKIYRVPLKNPQKQMIHYSSGECKRMPPAYFLYVALQKILLLSALDVLNLYIIFKKGVNFSKTWNSETFLLYRKWKNLNEN